MQMNGFMLSILNFHLAKNIKEEIHILRIVIIMDIESVIMFSEVIMVFGNNGLIIINTIIIIFLMIITISHDLFKFVYISNN